MKGTWRSGCCSGALAGSGAAAAGPASEISVGADSGVGACSGPGSNGLVLPSLLPGSQPPAGASDGVPAASPEVSDISLPWN